MRVSYQWLRDYVDLQAAPEAMADRLTMVGLEVEDLHDRYGYLNTVVAARVAEVADHPKSDHLKICRVEARDQSYQVICGAPNVKAGMVSALALSGTTLQSGLVVGEAEIRGVASCGMLCSEAELTLGPDASGIMELPQNAPIGTSIKSVLNLSDWIIEVGITPNRADCLSVIGVARELAGIYRLPLKIPAIDIRESDVRIEDLTSVSVVDHDHCPRYVARIIQDVKIGPSPFWMVDRLAAAGVRSISNVVDITNFVLMEIGQPLHAFDMNRLEDRRIVVRLAQDGDHFVTLDGNERTLTGDNLMICDGKRQVGIAGVMGGLNTEIQDDTTQVLLESAHFSPVSIRKTSKRLGLSTEASYRFERGVDPENCKWAADRAAALMADLSGGRVARGVIDQYPIKHQYVHIPFSPEKCNAFLGTSFKHEEIISALNGIGIETVDQGGTLQAKAPSFRFDLFREVDLFEEAARLMGFDRIPTTRPPARDQIKALSDTWRLRLDARSVLEGLGLSEAVNYSFISEDFREKLKLPADDKRRKAVRIINPLSEDQSLLRTTLMPGLLDVLRRNQSYGVWDVALYEIGMVFFQRENEKLPEERLTIGGLLSGSRFEASWHSKPESIDFFDAKGVVEDLLTALRVPAVSWSPEGIPAFIQPGAAAAIHCGNELLGWVGKISPAVTKKFDLRTDAAYGFEIDLPAVMAVRMGLPVYQPLPRFPYVERDVALILDHEVEAGRVEAFIRALKVDFFRDLALFDAYEGAQIGAGKRSLGFRIRYQSEERTLTDEEVNAAHQSLTAALMREFSAALRT